MQAEKCNEWSRLRPCANACYKVCTKCSKEVKEDAQRRRKLPVHVFQCAGSSAALVLNSTCRMRVLAYRSHLGFACRGADRIWNNDPMFQVSFCTSL